MVTQKVDLSGYGSVSYHPTGIANILSLNDVCNKYQVTFNSVAEHQGFVVHKEDLSKWIFRPSEKGLHYLDVLNDVGTILVQTVASNKAKIPSDSILVLKKLILYKTL